MKRTSANSNRQRRRGRAAASNDNNTSSVATSATSHQSEDRDILSIIQQDDQELAEAKLNAKQQNQQHRTEPSGVVDTNTTASSVSQQHIPQPQPAGKLTTRLPENHHRKSIASSTTKKPPTATISLPIRPTRQVDDDGQPPTAPIPPRHAQSTGNLNNTNQRADKERSKVIAGPQYASRDQAVATNLAFRESQ